MEANPGRDLTVPPNERSVQLAQLSTLPDGDWVTQISQLYPDVAPVGALNSDLQNLDELGEMVMKDRRQKSRMSRVLGGIAVLIAAGIIAGEINLIDPSTKASDLLWIMVPVTFGLAAYILYEMANEQTPGITNRVRTWNGQGQNWVQQQRDRLGLN